MAIYSGFFPLNMVIFHSYVKLPEGMQHSIRLFPRQAFKFSLLFLQNTRDASDPLVIH
jgi:hypothetical protein